MATLTKTICDIDKCENEVKDFIQGAITVIFTTEQTEGRSVKPHLTNLRMDICEDCLATIILHNRIPTGSGAQGHNTYTLKKE